MVAVSLVEYHLSRVLSNEPGFITKHFCNEVLDKTAKDSWITDIINSTPLEGRYSFLECSVYFDIG
jgi:hypothetical protein